MEKIKSEIIKNLKEVYDPEIPINIYDLGLIYEINIKKNNDVEVIMSLTSPTCPTAEYIQTMVEDAVKDTPNVKNVQIKMTFDPMWTPDKMSDEAKEELGLVENKEDNLEMINMFKNNSNPHDEKNCFNCGSNSEKYPIFSCIYKNENIFICSKCILKFT